MHDYMRALRQRFFRKSQCEELRQTVDTTSKELFTRMGDEDKRKLLLIVDSMDAIRDEVSLDSFVAGLSRPGESAGSWKQMASTPSMRRR